MKQKQFKLIGFNIKNSVSPFIHKKIFEHKNKQTAFSYEIVDTQPDEFNSTFKKLNQFAGVNITTPYKIKTFKRLKFKSAKAIFFGCVNTVKTLNTGELKGFCTDHIGFLKSLELLKIRRLENVLIIGFGGTGQMAAICLQNKCKKLIVAVRNTKKIPNSLKKTINAQFVNLNTLKLNSNFAKVNFQLVVNATTCGNSTSPDESAINLEKLGQVSNVFDLIYYPTQTKLLKQAKQLGAKTLNGVSMLVWQAVAAQKIWNNFSFKTRFIKNLINCTEHFLQERQKHV